MQQNFDLEVFACASHTVCGPGGDKQGTVYSSGALAQTPAPPPLLLLHAQGARVVKGGALLPTGTNAPQVSVKMVLMLQAAGQPGSSGTEDGEAEAMEDDGDYLSGSAKNTAIMQNFLLTTLKIPPENVREVNFTLVQAEAPGQVIKSFLASCKRQGKEPVIFYTGHGSGRDGSWCFTHVAEIGKKGRSVRVSPQDVLAWNGGEPVQIVSQSCHSGFWLEYHYGFASARFSEVSYSSEEGSEFTRWLCSKGPVPQRSVPQSRGSHRDSGYVSAVGWRSSPIAWDPTW